MKMIMVKSKVFIDSIWSFIERFSVQGLQFLFSIILARLLSPSDYGLIAMLSIFLALSQTLLDCGFSNALIRKIDRTDIDKSTVFFIIYYLGFYYILHYSFCLLISHYFMRCQFWNCYYAICRL